MVRLSEHAQVRVDEMTTRTGLVFSCETVQWQTVLRKLDTTSRATLQMLRMPTNMNAQMPVRCCGFESDSSRVLSFNILSPYHANGLVVTVQDSGMPVVMDAAETFCLHTGIDTTSISMRMLELPAIGGGGVDSCCVVCEEEITPGAPHDCAFWALATASTSIPDAPASKTVLVRVEDRLFAQGVYITVVTPKNILLATLSVVDVLVYLLLPHKQHIDYPLPPEETICGGDNGLTLGLTMLPRIIAHYMPLFSDTPPAQQDRVCAFLTSFGERVARAGSVMAEEQPMVLPYSRCSLEEYCSKLNVVRAPRNGHTTLSYLGRFVQDLQRAAMPLNCKALRVEPTWRYALERFLCSTYGDGEKQGGLTIHIRRALDKWTPPPARLAQSPFSTQTRIPDYTDTGLSHILTKARATAGRERAFIAFLTTIQARYAQAQVRFFVRVLGLSDADLEHARDEDYVLYEMRFLAYVCGVNWRIVSPHEAPPERACTGLLVEFPVFE